VRNAYRTESAGGIADKQTNQRTLTHTARRMPWTHEGLRDDSYALYTIYNYPTEDF